MSLEQAVRDNTEALNELINVIRTQTASMRLVEGTSFARRIHSDTCETLEECAVEHRAAQPAASLVAEVVAQAGDTLDASTLGFGKGTVPVIANPTPEYVGVATPVTQLDKNGFPWDERIHASTKAVVADGSWRYKRGVNEALIAQVEDELRGTYRPPVAIDDSSPSELNIDPAAHPSYPGVVPPPPPVASPVAAVPPPPPPAPVSEDRNTFANLIAAITVAINSQALTMDQVRAALAHESVGLKSLPEIATRSDLIPELAALLGLTL